MTKIDWTKPVRGKVTLSAVTLLHDAFVVSYPDGRIQFVRENELENFDAPRIVWLNVYPNDAVAHDSRERADNQATTNRKYVLRINLETGETVKETA